MRRVQNLMNKLHFMISKYLLDNLQNLTCWSSISHILEKKAQISSIVKKYYKFKI